MTSCHGVALFTEKVYIVIGCCRAYYICLSVTEKMAPDPTSDVSRAPTLTFLFFIGCMRLIIVQYLHFFIVFQVQRIHLLFRRVLPRSKPSDSYLPFLVSPGQHNLIFMYSFLSNMSNCLFYLLAQVNIVQYACAVSYLTCLIVLVDKYPG